MKKIKRLPPILFPIWLLLFLGDKTARFFMWLVGYWWCSDCKRRFFIYTERFKLIYPEGKFNRRKNTVHYKNKVKQLCDHCNQKYKETITEE